MINFPRFTEMPITPANGEWTRADWEQLPHGMDYKYEIIDGVLYMSTSPKFIHNWIIRRLDEFVGTPAERAGLGIAGTIEVGVFMTGTQPVQPDFLFVRAGRDDVLIDDHINGVPDLVIEVLSPGNRAYDLEVKFLAYETAGVPEYGIVDAIQKQLRLYRLGDDNRYGEPLVLSVNDTITFACLPTITLRVGDLFDGAPS